MNLNNQPSDPSTKKPVANSFALYSVGAQVGCATLIIVFFSVFVGIGLDRLLGTKPVFTILFVLGSAPLSLFLTFKLAMRAVKSVTPQEPGSKQIKPVEEEEKRE